MMRSKAGVRTTGLALGLGGALLTGCASNRNLVVVLPEANSHVGAVVVHAGASSTVLDRAYAAAAPTPAAARPLKPGAYDAARVNAIFGGALAALPAEPADHTVSFELASRTLTAEDEAGLRAFLDGMRSRKAVEIVITGYTDTMGAEDYNLQLSRDRAESVRQTLLPILKEYGVAADSVAVVGRGKNGLAVPTPDQTPEPRNRRVVITVR